MASYQPKLESLLPLRAIWRVEEDPMDQIGEAYYLGGDFDGGNDCRFYYMVWRDGDLGRWYAGLNAFGQLEVPFSRMRYTTIGGFATLREALNACEQHADGRTRHLHRTLALAA